jgi:hypothetical protein
MAFYVLTTPDHTHTRHSIPSICEMLICPADYLSRPVELTLDQYGLKHVPHSAVHAADADQVKRSFQCDGHSDHKHEQNGVHEHPTLVKKVDHRIDIHGFPPHT